MSISPHFFLYLAVMAGVCYLVRMLPMVLIRRKIKNRFLRSFLYYIPYAVLAAMTFPTILFAPEHLISGILAAVVCTVLGFFRQGLIIVAAGGALTVFISELIISVLPMI